MAVALERTRRLFNVAEYERMAEVGILAPHERIELIRGEIVEMSPIGARHIAFVTNLTHLLVRSFDGRALVSVQSPVIVADDSMPQPDLVLLRLRQPSSPPYKVSRPRQDDVQLLIEVAESSLRYDRSVKLRLYAEVGVPEYWVVDCEAEAIEVYSSPSADGYRSVVRRTGGESVSPLAYPDVALRLADIFA
jgi:Uma2 family endonuclease